VTDPSNDKRNRAGSQRIPQHETDVQHLREKTARLRELRLPQKVPLVAAVNASTPGGHKTSRKKAGKPREGSQSLSDWLTTRHNEGRRS
jgi:hypothetical protein